MGEETSERGETTRRRLLTTLAGTGAAAVLVGAYGTFAAMVLRFLYPAGRAPQMTYVARADQIQPGKAFEFQTPAGGSINVANRAGSADSIVALSSTCPHLGCQVHWQPQQERFFCPCHNGVFDVAGRAVSGPPADAGQDLLEYPIEVRDGLVFIALPDAALAEDRHTESILMRAALSGEPRCTRSPEGTRVS